jgi:hypothetical protein
MDTLVKILPPHRKMILLNISLVLWPIRLRIHPKGSLFRCLIIDWTSRVLRDDKRISTRPQLLVLDELGIDDQIGCELESSFDENYHGAVGSLEELASYAEHAGTYWIAKKNILHRSLH